MSRRNRYTLSRVQRSVIRPFTATATASVISVLAVGCMSISGESDKDAQFDLCSVLTTNELVELGYLRASETSFVSRHIDSSYLYEENFASCNYGTGLYGGIAVSYATGERAPDIADLVDGTYDATGRDLTIAGAPAYMPKSRRDEVTVAVDNGSLQFVLSWTAPTSERPDTMPESDIVRIAEMILDRLPDDAHLPGRDLPVECETLEDNSRSLVGEISLAWGTVSDGYLTCDFAGPKGTLTHHAVIQTREELSDSLDFLREYGDGEEVALAHGAVVMIEASQGFDVDGNDGGTSRLILSFKQVLTEAESTEAEYKRSASLSARAFAELTRKWSVSHA